MELALPGTVPFPQDLVRVGRPIEELFRFNARRGLLGPGPVDEAIERRLNHLRSGRPHMRESEKDDGTVLEIRGNPLPDGGFVTSYADITSYKNAARELRSLADALEHRIAERTHDLEEARREAEQANRYKTRFVASAVHDLLQPLNAARMFVSVLRGKLSDPAQQQTSDHIDAALAAQDAILNSLLDIARLESGSLPTRVQAFRLGPLLQTLAREFGIAAQSRGLVVDWVDTAAVVVSDEALLRRILQNFLSNALRYSERGRVLLGCRRREGLLWIEVHDQGPGIPDALQGEIFEEFRRLHDGQQRGAGLGLAIVDRIGRLLGHPIRLRSQPSMRLTTPRIQPDRPPTDSVTCTHGEENKIKSGLRAALARVEPSPCSASRTGQAALLLIFFSLPWMDAHGTCPWPGRWAAQGREPHGCGDRAYMDVLAAAPAQSTCPTSPMNCSTCPPTRGCAVGWN